MKLAAKLSVFLSLLLVALSLRNAPVVKAGAHTPGQDTVLKASDITPKLFPEHVFFRGQVAPTQLRNTGGVHFADDFFVLAGLVDSSGYSTAIKEKYQAYLLSEVTLEIGSQTLKPGAYGFGFVSGKFILMDLAANNIIEAAGQRDAEMKRPVPLQVVATQTPEAIASMLAAISSSSVAPTDPPRFPKKGKPGLKTSSARASWSRFFVYKAQSVRLLN